MSPTEFGLRRCHGNPHDFTIGRSRLYECFGKTLVQNGVLLCSVWAPAQLHCTKINGEMALLRTIQLKHMLLSLNLYLNRQALKFKITSIDKILVLYNNIPESKKIHALLYHLAGISLRVFRASVSKITVIIQDYALRREQALSHTELEPVTG